VWRRWLRRLRGRDGQATVEMALVVPVLVLLLFGIAEFGRLLFAYATIQDAAWAGARLGVIPGTTTAQIVQQVDQTASLLDQSQLSATVTEPNDPPYPGDPLTVTVSYNFNFLVGLFGGPITLQAASTLRVE
jgi:Flp pilus assembly protein TadG